MRAVRLTSRMPLAFQAALGQADDVRNRQVDPVALLRADDAVENGTGRHEAIPSSVYRSRRGTRGGVIWSFMVS